jgi:hypothetical protein
MSEVAPTPTTATAAAMRQSFRLKDIVGMFVSAPLLDGARRLGASDAAFWSRTSEIMTRQSVADVARR